MPPREIRLRGDKLLELVGLLERARDNISQYSKGMLQRLGLAQALLHQPRLIILDEPTDGLDPVGRAQVRTLLQRLKDEGHTVFLNSHILQEVELVCDRVAILDHGELRFVGAVDTLREQLSGDCEKDFELTVEVRGEKSRLMSAMAQCSIQSWQPTSPSQYQVVVRFQDQQRVDQFVDGLRAAEISILNLQRQRLTLEDAFLKLLASKKA
jgi:ABC-2 type transport system ATP-binding protein